MDNKNKKKGNRGNKGQKGGQKQNWSFKEPEFFTTSLTGFLITSNQHQEKNAVKDAYNFLNKYVDRDYEREIQDILDGLDVPEKKVKLDQPFEEKKEDGENAGNTEPAPKVENEGGSTEPQEKQEQQAQEIVEVKAEAEPAEKKVQENAAAMLEKELKSLQKDKRLFYNVETNCKGIIFIKINPLFKDVLDVKHVANKIVRDVRENKIPVSRFCFKLIPIEVACKAALNTFQENIKPLIERKFKADKPRKWVLHFKCRNNNKFTQQPFLDYILEIIGQGHSVDFKNPDYVIFVEINNHLMTLSILKKFLKYKNYSLQLPDSNPAQKPKTDKPKEAGDSSVPKPSLVGELEFDVPETNEPEGEEQAQGETKPEPEGEDEEDDVPLL